MTRHPGSWAWILGMVLILASAGIGAAQGWNPFVFAADERYGYRVQTLDDAGRENPTVLEQFYTLEVRRLEGLSPLGEPLFDVTSVVRARRSSSQLSAELQWGGLPGAVGLNLGNPFEVEMLLELDLQVGESRSLPGLGQLSVAEEVTVAGRRGFLIQHEVAEGGARRLVSQWVIDPQLPLPMVVRTFTEEGRMASETMLQHYERF